MQQMKIQENEHILHGQGYGLPTPPPPYKAVAQARFQSHDIHGRFFENMLGDIDEPTFPYGMAETHRNGSEITESQSVLP